MAKAALHTIRGRGIVQKGLSTDGFGNESSANHIVQLWTGVLRNQVALDMGDCKLQRSQRQTVSPKCSLVRSSRVKTVLGDMPYPRSCPKSQKHAEGQRQFLLSSTLLQVWADNLKSPSDELCEQFGRSHGHAAAVVASFSSGTQERT